MHAQNHFERDVWDEMAVLLPPGAPIRPLGVNGAVLLKEKGDFPRLTPQNTTVYT